MSYTITDLQYLMARLRDPDGGCPWDLEQTYRSIAPSTIEEAYEVADTIERDDLEHLPEELGDLLFQVIFYCQFGREQERFDLDQVVDTLVSKLIRRHPHVFPSGNLYDEKSNTNDLEQQAVKASWESIKADERSAKGLASMLDDVPVGLPGLSRAQKLQKRVARAGWDWRTLEGVLAKVDEELAEVREALADAKTQGIDPGKSGPVVEELGDLIFMTVNLARFLDLDAETSLRGANHKFERRIQFMERALADSGEAFKGQSDARLDALWEEAKRAEKS